MKAGSVQVNPCYIPQIQEVLRWPQSAGIVGGRPDSSLFFIGVQDQNVLYLDPHEIQQVLHPGFYNLYDRSAAVADRFSVQNFEARQSECASWNLLEKEREEGTFYTSFY